MLEIVLIYQLEYYLGTIFARVRGGFEDIKIVYISIFPNLGPRGGLLSNFQFSKIKKKSPNYLRMGRGSKKL